MGLGGILHRNPPPAERTNGKTKERDKEKMSKKYDDYLKTDYWKAVTHEVKKRADFRCQICNSQHDLCAHHRTYEHRGRELEFLGDLVCLCRRCHAIFHGKIEAEAVIHREPKTKQPKPRIATPEQIEAAEKDMPEGDPVTVTIELIQKCRTARFAFTNATIRAFGLKAPLISGWPARLCGSQISRDNMRAALIGRNVYNSGSL